MGVTNDKSLIIKRDKDIVEKFNYYYEIKRYRYDYALYLMKWNHFYMNEKSMHKILKRSGIKTPPLSRSFKNSSTNENGDNKFQARNKALRARFVELYEKEQMRMDDTMKRIRNEYYISERTIDSILCEWHVYKTLVTSQQEIQF